MGEAAAALEAAVSLYRAERFDEALEQFERLVDESDEPGTPSYWAGLAASALGRADEAVDHLVLAAHHRPGDDAVRLALGEALLAAGRAEEALESLREGARDAADATPLLRASASALKQLGRHDEAVTALERVAAARPGDAADRSRLALALLRAGRLDAAHARATEALQLDPHCIEACQHAGLVERERGGLEEALALFRRALELRPGSPEIRSALAHALRDLGQLDAALAEYDAVLARHPGFPDATLNRAYLLLMAGRYAEGWDAYESRAAFPGILRPPPALPPWEGGSGARVLVVGEQGIGDQVMFASCLPDLVARAGPPAIACHARLRAILGRSFPGTAVFAQDELEAAARAASSWVSIGSLPRFFRRSADAFPSAVGYLKADPQRAAAWTERLQTADGSLCVGLSWRGGTTATRGQLRSVPVATLARLAALPGVRFTSLQYGDASADVAALQAAGLRVERDRAIEQDLDECAAAMAALDLVLSIDNTVAHLAGALGRPTWILVHAGAEWRYGTTGGSMPWYPGARLFRQAAPGGWEAVLDAVSEALGRTSGATGRAAAPRSSG